MTAFWWAVLAVTLIVVCPLIGVGFGRLISRDADGGTDAPMRRVHAGPEPDLTRLAIERLLSMGTDRSVALATEIERGRARREGDTETPWVAPDA